MKRTLTDRACAAADKWERRVYPKGVMSLLEHIAFVAGWHAGYRAAKRGRRNVR